MAQEWAVGAFLGLTDDDKKQERHGRRIVTREVLPYEKDLLTDKGS